MNKLFIELYLDENVSVIVARILRARGVSVLTTDECGNKGKTDGDQMKFAIDNELVLVTMDRIDFEKIAQDHFRGMLYISVSPSLPTTHHRSLPSA